MKTLLVGEYREGRLQDVTSELEAFARQRGGERVMFLVGDSAQLPAFAGTLYLAAADRYGEYNPPLHKQLLLDVIAREEPDVVAFAHSSCGWDLAPRIACALGVAQLSGVVAVEGEGYVVTACNGKLQRRLIPAGDRCVVTIQPGAFPGGEVAAQTPTVVAVETDADIESTVEFLGYEPAETGQLDLDSAPVVVAAGRGVGKKENIASLQDLAAALGGELGASRPVVDLDWVERNRQIGSTGQCVAPKLYIACGISGAIQHLLGMKNSAYIVAVNTDRDAPIAEVADVLVAADLNEFIPTLTEAIKQM